LTRKMVMDYEDAVHAAYPKALGAMAVVAALDLDLYHRLCEQADRLYAFENEVGLRALSFAEEGGIPRLAALTNVSKEFYVSLPLQLAQAMRDARVQPTVES
jgi:hypothetical protein